MEYIIRPFKKEDRDAVRTISCETAFLDVPRREIFSDDEILADALIGYYTDYEPQSCFVAESDHKVIGYVIGSKDVHVMDKVFNAKILGPLFIKAFWKNLFFNFTNLRFFLYVFRSALRGEFFSPFFSNDFPGTLHINIKKGFRGQGIGEVMIQHYVQYLKNNSVPGLHFGTLSDKAKEFFLKNGFMVLYQGSRSYLRPYTGKETNYYVLGRKLS